MRTAWARFFTPSLRNLFQACLNRDFLNVQAAADFLIGVAGHQ